MGLLASETEIITAADETQPLELLFLSQGASSEFAYLMRERRHYFGRQSRANLRFLFCSAYCKIARAYVRTRSANDAVAFQGEPGAFSEAAAIQLLANASPLFHVQRSMPLFAPSRIAR